MGYRSSRARRSVGIDSTCIPPGSNPDADHAASAVFSSAQTNIGRSSSITGARQIGAKSIRIGINAIGQRGLPVFRIGVLCPYVQLRSFANYRWLSTAESYDGSN